MGTSHSTVAGTAASGGTSRETEQQSISLLLCGPTGTGKSSTGNHILENKSFFEVDDNDVATTLECKIGYSKFNDFNIKVVDMPGLENYEAHDVKATGTSRQIAVRYDAVLLTIRYGRLPNYTKEPIKKLKKIYGKDVLQQRGVLVMTHGDEFKQNRLDDNVDDYCSQQKDLLNSLWKKCDKRVVLFDNATKDTDKLRLQREKLFSIVMGIRSATHKGQLYQDSVVNSIGCFPSRRVSSTADASS